MSAVNFFEQADTKKNNTLDFEEFKTGLTLLQMNLSFVQMDIFFIHFDQNESGLITQKAFLSVIEDETYLQLLTNHLYKYCHTENINIDKLVEKYSKAGGSLNMNEFRMMCKEVSNYQLDENQIDLIFTELDVDKSNTIEISEIEAIYEEDKGINLVTYIQFKMTLLDYCKKNRMSLFDIFNQYDVGKKQYLGRPELDKMIKNY